jgi:hypothetical protein
MLAVRTPITGIFIAVLVLVAEVVAMKAYVAAQRPAPTIRHHHEHAHRVLPAPTFGKHHGCADRLRISGPDDIAQPGR